jgi:hypothetical protein
MTLAAPDMHCFVEWVWAPCAKPPCSGKYVVEIDCGNGLCYLSTRSYNAEAAGMWLDMAEGEMVAYWLRDLSAPQDLVVRSNLAQRLNDTKYRGCLHCAAQPGERHQVLCPHAT